MLKAAVKIAVIRKLKGKCPNHPRYNPELGDGFIRGACPHCRALYEAVEARDQLYAAIRHFEEATDAFMVVRKPRALC